MTLIRGRLLPFFLLISVLALIWACTKGPAVPYPAFDFSLEDIFTGEVISMSELKGRPLLLYFFASW